MEPTLLVDDCLIMRQEKEYPLLDHKIVVLRDPEGSVIPIVKRVIAGPSSIVSVRNGYVYLQDSKTPLPGEPKSKYRTHRWILKDDEIFVMGDNRNNSEDSTNFGPVKREDILGVITWRYWPLSRIGRADSQ